MENTMTKSTLSPYQKYYWKNPEHFRQLQRNKYLRYPKRIKERNAKWDAENAEYIQTLRKFNSSIYYYKIRGNEAKVAQLTKAKEDFKKNSGH